ncbi:mechanosensitive ion channel family protein [Candidatus Woesearchaeota archaeon]|nr:mechanosensitive ion channel family protein [Candidatus Woesearchaeota archaeon]
MADFIAFLQSIGARLVPLWRTIVTVIIFLILFNITLNVIKKALLRRAKTKHLKSNIRIFTRIAKYTAFLAIAIFAVFTYAGSWTGLGLSIGLFSAALGWALQRPITGIAGWIMVIIKRPFELGDRIIIGKVRGDVVDITLTHIYVQEIGGIIGGEENSGRVVMIPNSKLFEQDIINYTFDTEHVLAQVAFTITFESNVDKAVEIAVDAARKNTRKIMKETESKPYTRLSLHPNGMEVRIRFMTPAKQFQEFQSIVTKDIFDNLAKAKDIRLSYPHNEVLFTKRK